MALARERVQEKQPLVEDEAPLTLDISDTYQSSRKIPFKRNKPAAIVEALFESLFLSFLLAEESLAINEVVQTDPNTVIAIIQGTNTEGLPSFIGSLGWLIMVGITAGWTTGVWLYAVVAASCNAQAVVAKAELLPYPPLSRKVAWLTIQMLMWWIVLGGFTACWILNSGWSAAVQAGAFVGRMFLVLLFGIFTSFPLIMTLFRKSFDACLACCKSPCYDL